METAILLHPHSVSAGARKVFQRTPGGNTGTGAAFHHVSCPAQRIEGSGTSKLVNWPTHKEKRIAKVQSHVSGIILGICPRRRLGGRAPPRRARGNSYSKGTRSTDGGKRGQVFRCVDEVHVSFAKANGRQLTNQADGADARRNRRHVDRYQR